MTLDQLFVSPAGADWSECLCSRCLHHVLDLDEAFTQIQKHNASCELSWIWIWAASEITSWECFKEPDRNEQQEHEGFYLKTFLPQNTENKTNSWLTPVNQTSVPHRWVGQDLTSTLMNSCWSQMVHYKPVWTGTLDSDWTTSPAYCSV